MTTRSARMATLYLFLSCVASVSCLGLRPVDYESDSDDYGYKGDGRIKLVFSKSSMNIQIGRDHILKINPSGPLEHNVNLFFTYTIGNSTYVDPPKDYICLLNNVTIPANDTTGLGVKVEGHRVGQVILGLKANSSEIEREVDSHVHITVMHSEGLNILSQVIGWLYFVAWSISFYPQVILNIQRRSVAGLNFDFLALNFVGFLFYSLFNVGLKFIPEVQTEYHAIHPWGIIPVEMNDVVFALHALLLTIITIAQCFCFQRNNQSVSWVCRGILGLIGVGTVIVVGLKLGHVMDLLSLLYFFSYVKLGITIIKYVPQAWFNYKRGSTVGWSIGNILLDFTGGSLSIIQMFILAYNNDDWGSIFGNPTKFGLGLFSVLFDILFMVQHYCLYRHTEGYSEIIPGLNSEKVQPLNDPIINGDEAHLSRGLVE